MLTSVRNQFSGTVKAVHIGAVNAKKEIALKGGEIIISSITKDSVAYLGFN